MSKTNFFATGLVFIVGFASVAGLWGGPQADVSVAPPVDSTGAAHQATAGGHRPDRVLTLGDTGVAADLIRVARTGESKTPKQRRCGKLKAKIRKIDQQARRGGTAKTMDRLRDRKRSAQQAMWDLNC